MGHGSHSNVFPEKNRLNPSGSWGLTHGGSISHNWCDGNGTGKPYKYILYIYILYVCVGLMLGGSPAPAPPVHSSSTVSMPGVTSLRLVRQCSHCVQNAQLTIRLMEIMQSTCWKFHKTRVLTECCRVPTSISLWWFGSTEHFAFLCTVVWSRNFD